MAPARLEAISAFKKVPVKFGNYKLRYAWVSQRGFYPDEPDKANQDAHVEVENFCADQGIEDMHLFGVFDGHGKTGDLCAQWARDQVPLELAKCLKAYPDDMERSFKEAFVKVNTTLHENKQIDDKMSGTTAIVVLVNKGSLHIANVGDSRAIVAQMLDTKLTAYSLSQDQTPFRKDERERCKRVGAQIATMDQLEGLEPMHENWGDTAETGGEEGDGDPPRVWIPNQMSPGCAFTRSIGDQVGESVGVFAEPELLKKQLVGTDKFIIVASDGVWEFMTNQMVVDMTNEFKSPLKACKAVVQEAYKLWLQFDVRTDDITMTLVMLDDTEGLEAAFLAEQARLLSLTKAPGGAPSGGSRAELRRQSTATLAVQRSGSLTRRQSALGVTLGAKAVEGEQVRPVRRVMTKEKRQVVQGTSADEDTSFASSLVGEKGWSFEAGPEGDTSAAEQASIKRAVATNFLLAHLNEEQQAVVFAKMQTCKAKKGDTIIAKGQPGDWFYVVSSGSYNVVIDGATVFTYAMEEEGDAHPSFGELALLYSNPRAASIVCSTGGKLWRLHRSTFRAVVMRSSAQQLTKTLRGVEVLKFLTISQLQRLQDALSEVKREQGAKVIVQGDPGKEFFIIMEGEAAVTVKDGAEVKEVMKLKQYDYFGERALLNDAPRAATVTAVTPMKLLYISKALFEEVLGPLDRLIDTHRKMREERANNAYLQRQAEGLLDATHEEFDPMGKVLSSAHQDIYVVVRRIERSLADQSTVDQAARASMASGGAAGNTNARLSSLGTVHANGDMIEQRFSMRVLPKKRVAEAQMQKRVLAEMSLLGTLPPNPFVPILLACFSDSRRLFAVLSAVLVTDLQTACEGIPLDERAARFYVAGVFRALTYVHEAEVVCRACSLDAVMLDAKGYPQLTDFSLSKSVTTGRTHTLCGTPDYLAPEIVKMTGHGIEADYWALGVLMFELLAAHSPWDDPPREGGGEGGGEGGSEGGAKVERRSEIQVYAAITAHGQDGAPPLRFPAELTDGARGMISELMEPDLGERLGCRGAGPDDLTDCTEWYVGFPWSALDQKLQPDAKAEPKWCVFRPKCEALARGFFSPDGGAEEVEFEAPAYYGENRWCVDWDFMCTVGYTVADARENDKHSLTRKGSITHGSL